jgi:D-xylose transport system ATP-binding protein
VVLRLGRNAGEFRTAETTPEGVVAAITGGAALAGASGTGAEETA